MGLFILARFFSANRTTTLIPTPTTIADIPHGLVLFLTRLPELVHVEMRPLQAGLLRRVEASGALARREGLR